MSALRATHSAAAASLRVGPQPGAGVAEPGHHSAAEALHLFDSQPGALAAEPRHLSSPEPASLPRSATRRGPIGDPAAFSRALRRPARLWL